MLHFSFGFSFYDFLKAFYVWFFMVFFMAFLLMVPDSLAEFSITFFNHWNMPLSKVTIRGDANRLTGVQMLSWIVGVSCARDCTERSAEAMTLSCV